MSKLKKAIEYYYKKGFKVFPIRLIIENGKKRLVNMYEWRKNGIDETKAASLLTEDKNGVAILTGREQNLLVLDVDNKPGKAFEEILEEYDVYIDPKTPRVETISGGMHYYFAYTEGIIGKTTRNITSNIDIRGDGGIVFAPPTEINGNKYTWLKAPNGKLPEMPKGLIKFINDNDRKIKKNGKRDYKKVADAVRFLKKTKLTYDEWVKCGMAISEMGEAGRKYWIELSQNEFYNDSLDDLNDKYDNFLETTDSITIASLFEVAKQCGYTWEHEDNETIYFDKQQILDAIKIRVLKGEDDTYSLGWDKMDEAFKITKGQLIIISGVPSAGKSNWMDAVMINMAKKYDWRWFVFAPESQPIEDHVESLIKKYVDMPITGGWMGLPILPESEYDICCDFIAKHFLITDTTKINRKIESLLDRVENEYYRSMFDAVLFDPWNEIRHDVAKDFFSETEYIGYILGKIKALCIKLNIVFFIVAHPRKVIYDIEQNKLPLVAPYDIAGSANWYNKADGILMVTRYIQDSKDRRVFVFVQKVKRVRLGHVGKVEFEYIPATENYV